MRVLGVIPARGGSKGVPGKNIKDLGGKPLIAYTIEAARDSKLDRCIVSTDDDEIASISRDWGGQVPFLRPAEMATDSAKALPAIRHALEMAEKEEGSTYDAVMVLQPTTPFRRAADIDEAIDMLKSTNADSVISVVDVEGHHPARMKYLEDGRLIDPPFCEAVENQPRQELRPMYLRNGVIYLTRKTVLLEGTFKGKDCRAMVMDSKRSINIDTPLDFQMAEFLVDKINLD
ncbi:MAG: acylneuraminate cytidylyltransferase family protein [Bacteroidetes bacterium]|nr:acylneuraminate cytidylyltransferase family protein [Bacteroidota bacterium]